MSQLPAKIARYREQYRAEKIGPRYSGWLHLGFTSTVALSAIVLCVWQVENVQGWEWWAIPAAFLYANLAEYWGHRGPMHRPFRGLREIYERHAAQHHRFFTHETMAFDSSRDFHAVLFPPVMAIFFFGVFATPFWLILSLLTSENFAWLSVATGVAYFLNYEWLHFSYHCDPQSWVGRLPGMATLRRLHQDHHDPQLMAHYNFNISYPIWDWVFGTLKYRQQNSNLSADTSTH